MKRRILDRFFRINRIKIIHCHPVAPFKFIITTQFLKKIKQSMLCSVKLRCTFPFSAVAFELARSAKADETVQRIRTCEKRAVSLPEISVRSGFSCIRIPKIRWNPKDWVKSPPGFSPECVAHLLFLFSHGIRVSSNMND